MATINYLRNTKSFWKERETARVALDRKRSSAPRSEKVIISARLHSDATFLKSGRVVKAKH